MSAATPESVRELIVDVSAVRAALRNIPGIVRAVHVRTQRGEESVWIVLDGG